MFFFIMFTLTFYIDLTLEVDGAPMYETFQIMKNNTRLIRQWTIVNETRRIALSESREVTSISRSVITYTRRPTEKSAERVYIVITNIR